MTKVHKFCVTQPTTSFALLSTQQMIVPRILGNAIMHNLLRSLAKAFSLFLSHSFTLFSSLGRGLPPPPLPCCTSTGRKQCFNQNADSHTNGHEDGSDHNALLLKQHSYPFSQSGILAQNFGDRLFDARNLVGEFVFKEIDAFLFGFQVVIQVGNSLLDVFSHAIIVVHDISDFRKFVLFSFDVLLF